jgi:hypothetical protein
MAKRLIKIIAVCASIITLVINIGCYNPQTGVEGITKTANSATEKEKTQVVSSTMGITVAAFNATAKEKTQADYTCTGESDQIQINAAIKDVSSVGGTVQLSEGDFTISAPIIMASGVKLVGSGGGNATVIKLADNSNCDMVWYKETVSTARFMYIGYMSLGGNKTNQSAGHGINFDGTSQTVWDFEIERVFTTQCYGDGMHFNKIWGGHIHNNNSEYNGGCGYYVRGTQAHLASNYSASNDGDGYYIESTRNHIVDCQDEASLNGLEYYSTDYCSFDSLILKDPQSKGITGSSAFYSTFTNSYTGTKWTKGFYIHGSNNLLIQGFSVNDCTTGIDETATTFNNQFYNNNIDTTDVTTPVTLAGTNTKIRGNIGYVTENSGTATIRAGTNSIIVAHGLVSTPTMVLVTMISNPSVAVSTYITNENTTDFSINISGNVSNDTSFYWRAVIGDSY